MKSVSSSSMPLKDRLSPRLLLLFAATFVIVFLGGLVYDVFASLGENLLLEAQAPPPAVTAIDPKLEGELAKVLEFDSGPGSADIKDPFTDQAGISDNAKTTTGAVSSQTVAPQTVKPGAANNPSAQKPAIAGSTSPGNVNSQNIPPGSNSVEAVSPVAETKMRMRTRDERISVGLDGGPEASVFAIDDLLPVGIVSGGDGQEEIMFYSLAANRIVSFPVGTRFYDGWLVERRAEGVVFGSDDRQRTLRMRGWERDLKGRKIGGYSGFKLPDQSALATGSN